MPETEPPKITFRPLTEADYPLIEEWWRQDEDHREFSPQYFRLKNTSSFMFEDTDGPVFAVRLAPVLRIGCQFDHSKSDRDREKRRRTARALKYFLAWIEDGARQQKFTELIYSSVSRDLIKFVQKVANYFPSTIEYRKRLYTTDTGNTPIIPSTEDADARSTQ